MAREAGVANGSHGRVGFEKRREPLRGLAHAGRAQLQGLQALEHDPGVERAHDRPRGAHEGHEVVCEVRVVAQDGAAQAAALAVDVLGRGVDHDVGAESEGALDRRHAEHVVHDNAGADAVGEGGDRGDVHDRHGRVAGAFEEDAAGLRPERALPRVEIGAVHEIGLDAVAGQQLVDHHVAGAEHDSRSHDVVARAKLAHQGREDRRHAGGGRLAGIRALDQCEAVLEHGDGGVAEAAVDVAGLFVRRARIALRGRVVDEARGEVERLAGFAVMRAVDSAPHQLCGLPPGPFSFPSLHMQKPRPRWPGSLPSTF